MFLLRNAQLGGMISGIIEGIGNMIGGWFQSIFGWLWYQIATALYTVIIMPLLLLVDGLSILFRKFAGLGSYTSKGVVYENNDFLYALITNDSIKNVFWSMLILGIVLLFITTFVAVIKSETTPLGDKNGENNKWKILKTTFRSIINFAIVPICAFVGIMIGNVLLRSLDSATGGGDGVSISNRVFVSSAYQSNRVRIAMDLIENGENYEKDDDYTFANELAKQEYKKDFLSLNESQQYELAQFVDDLFSSKAFSGDGYSYYNISSVRKYYNIGNYNILLGAIEGIAICALMILLTVGLIKRLFAVVTLFVISPPIIAVSPLNPNALKDWNKNFIAQVISGYASIVTMNMYLIIMGAMSDIQFVSSSEFVFSGFINSIVMVLIAAAGLFFVKDISGEIAKLIGGADALGEGQKVAGKLAKSAAIGVGLGKAAAVVAKNGVGRISAAKGLHEAKGDTKKAREELTRLEMSGASKEKIDAQKETLAKAEAAQKERKTERDDAKAAFKKARTQLRDQSVQFGETFSETDFIGARQKDKIGDDMYYGKDSVGNKIKDRKKAEKQDKKNSKKIEKMKTKASMNIGEFDENASQREMLNQYLENGDISRAKSLSKALKNDTKYRTDQDYADKVDKKTEAYLEKSNKLGEKAHKINENYGASDVKNEDASYSKMLNAKDDINTSRESIKLAKEENKENKRQAKIEESQRELKAKKAEKESNNKQKE